MCGGAWCKTSPVSNIRSRARYSADKHRHRRVGRKGPRPGLRAGVRFGSLRGEEPLLVWRWRVPYGNSRASSSPKRQTPSKSRICSTPSPSRSTPGIAGLVPIRALKVRHSPPTLVIPFETDPPTLISFFLGYTGHEDWKFDVDMETQMLGSVKPYTRQVKAARHKVVPPRATQPDLDSLKFCRS